MKKDSLFQQIEFTSHEESVPRLLDRINAAKVFQNRKKILLKPNLVNTTPFPVTTNPNFCRQIIKYIQSCSDAEVIIAEGCGDAHHNTHEVFSALGYARVALDLGVELMDLNDAPLIMLEKPENSIFPQIYLPEIAFESYIVSLPVLKAHSLAQITGTLKNMMGFAPPKYYSNGGYWKKAFFHRNMQEAILELNRFVTPHLTIMDATIGLCDYHLGGPECTPHVNKLIAGFDPVELDKEAAGLLNLDWMKIFHIAGE